MKKKIFPFVAALLLVVTFITVTAFQHGDTDAESKIEGVWKMTQLSVANNGNTTVICEDGSSVLQHKIYSKGYVMWTRLADINATEWHGFGTYRFEDGKLIETLLTTSQSMEKYMENQGSRDFIIELDIDENQYTQTTCHEAGCTIEKYERVR